MKKTLLALFAVAALVSCTKDNVLENNNEAIGFNKTFIENSVKSVNDPSLTENTLSDFAVYGFVEGASLFNGTTVNKTISNTELKSEWKYEGTQYWIAGAKYDFAAVAPLTNGNWDVDAANTNKDQTTINFTNDGTKDLLHAKTATIVGKVSSNELVSFTFNHILSKVKFSFENAYNASNATIKVKEVKINNAYKTATATLNANTVWSNWASNVVLDFGAAVNENQDDDANTDGVNVSNTADAFAYNTTLESYNELFLIPGAVPTQTVNSAEVKGYKVTFTVDLLVNGTLVKSYEHTAYADFVPAAGNSYDIKTVITASNIDPEHAQEPIEFTVTSIKGWTAGTVNNGNSIL